MNKKFLSAVLFGAMIATTTSTFVSCKDYDDDIAGLQEQIDGVKSNLTSEVTSLRGELASAKTELQNELNGTKTELANTKTELANAKTDLQNAIASKADATRVSTLETKVSTLEGKVSTLEGKVSTLETKITEIDTLTTRLNKLSEDMATADAATLNAAKDGIAEVKAEYNALFKKTLTSLVLKPQVYYGGIEAVQVSAIQYQEIELGFKKVDANGDYRDDYAEPSNNTIQMTPLLSATYHMNPSSAVVPTDLGSYNFLIADKEYKPFVGSRALKSEILSAEPDGGDLKVTAKFTDGAFATGNKVTTLALEVTLEEGKVVTSDYAAVYAETITGFVLSNEKSEAACKEAHLYTTAEDAINGDAIVNVAWDSSVDLANYVETHYTTNEGACGDLAEETLEGYGFEYKYELVGYVEGNNETSQSVHAALKDSKLRPQLPKADGTAAAWEETHQSKATIGRMPLVRVSLIDTNSNKIVAAGYVKVEITATPGVNTLGATASKTWNTAFTLTCPMQAGEFTLPWYEIENQILAELGISKKEFDYIEEKNTGYKFDGTLWKKVPATNAEGHITEKAVKLNVEEVAVIATTADVDGTMTEVLKMTVDANYAYEYFQKNNTLTAIVRYAKFTGVDALGNDTYDYVYVTLNWTPAPKKVTPEGTIADADKKASYWFAKNSVNQGYDEIHVNVNVPGVANNIEDFEKDMLLTFVDEDITISGVAEVYEGFEDENLTKTLVFAKDQAFTLTVNGTKYTLRGNGTQLMSGSEVIAEIVNNKTILYKDNETAKILLNYAGRENLAQNVTATVLVQEENDCNEQLYKLNNNTFDVKFLRPISVTVDEDNMDDFIDGVDAGAEGSKVDLKLIFTDWRGESFDNDVYDYYAHYGVTSITADEANIETNANGSWAKHYEGDGMEIKYTEAGIISEGNYGYVTYTNNNSEVHDFKIRVPFTVTYTWGEINIVVEFNVAKTV